MNARSRVLRAIASVMLRGLAGVVGLCAATAALAQADKPLTIGVIELFPNPHFAHARKGIEEFAKKNNTNVIIQNANLDATKEAQFIQTFITRKVDAILVSAVSPTGSLAALRFAKSAGIPVVCYTTCVNAPEDKELAQAFVKSDNSILGVTTGKQAAAYIKAELGGKAKILMLTCEAYDVCKERRKGLNEQLAGLDVKILAEQEGFVIDKARPIAEFDAGCQSRCQCLHCRERGRDHRSGASDQGQGSDRQGRRVWHRHQYPGCAADRVARRHRPLDHRAGPALLGRAWSGGCHQGRPQAAGG